jgi:beta-aspartyl-dipeptidase (metallo-type)
MTLLVGAEAIYAPQLLEERNVLIAGGKVIGLLDDNAAEALQLMVEGLKLQQCGGCIITPGFIDCHVHITGGGGEAGPASR